MDKTGYESLEWVEMCVVNNIKQSSFDDTNKMTYVHEDIIYPQESYVLEPIKE